MEPPKTANSIRKVPILAPLAEALGNRLDGLKAEDYIFGGAQPYTHAQFINAWQQYCVSIGCAHPTGAEYDYFKKSRPGKTQHKHTIAPDFTLHQLRHEFASVLVQCDVSPQVAKELMGHADIATTQKWYAEAKSWAIEDAEKALNAHFSRKKIVKDEN
nr:MAG TPA: Integrase [Caudoviricetes sp.]